MLLERRIGKGFEDGYTLKHIEFNLPKAIPKLIIKFRILEKWINHIKCNTMLEKFKKFKIQTPQEILGGNDGNVKIKINVGEGGVVNLALSESSNVG